eukprot:g60370.t1
MAFWIPIGIIAGVGWGYLFHRRDSSRPRPQGEPHSSWTPRALFSWEGETEPLEVRTDVRLGPGEEVDLAAWDCPTCTLANGALDSLCVACHTPRPTRRPTMLRPPSAPPPAPPSSAPPRAGMERPPPTAPHWDSPVQPAAETGSRRKVLSCPLCEGEFICHDPATFKVHAAACEGPRSCRLRNAGARTR